MFLVVDDAVLVLIILQFLVGQIRETVCVFAPDAFPFLSEEDLFLRDDLFGGNGWLWLDLFIGDIARVS